MKILSIERIENDFMFLSFSNGKTKKYSLKKHLGSHALAKEVNKDLLSKIRIGEMGELILPNGIDLCPSSVEYLSEDL